MFASIRLNSLFTPLQIAFVCLVTANIHIYPQEGMPDIWHVVDVPGAWENSNIPEFRQFDGFAWYRAYFPIPSHWAGKRLFFSAGKIDDMDEVFFNGEKIGAYGSMPPLISDPASSIRRPYVIEPDLVQPGNWNLVAIRIYDKGGAGGITKGPVQIFSGNEAIDLAGKWFISRGDLPQLAHWDSFGDNIQRPQELNDYFNRTGRPASMDNYPLVGADKEGPRSAIQQAALLYKDNQNVHSNTEGKGDPLSPEAAIQQFQIQPGLGIDVALHEPECLQPLYVEFDEMGRMWVTQYIQYPKPAGIELITWDNHLRAVYDQDPPPPPFNSPELARFRGRDKITIHEDSDADGVFDNHQVFMDGLNIATSTAQDKDGVWVLNPPYLLFVPDRNHDDSPDGPPEVHLVGFGLEDTHSVANSLKWGPDGWLYGVTGSTVTARIQTPFNPSFKPLKFFGQTVWRYHPLDYRFELFAEGGWNNFGLEFDDQGRLFSGTNGGMQAVHFLQGAYYQKSFGKHGPHNNPFAFSYFDGMKLVGDSRRMIHQWIVYGGGAIPSYDGLMIGVNPLANLIVALKRQSIGSTFETTEIHKTIETEHKWFRPVHITTGPDGLIYISDFYDGRITHLDPRDNWDRDRGRIYRIRSLEMNPHPVINFRQLDSVGLLNQLLHPNRWNRDTARRLIYERNELSVIPTLQNWLVHSSDHQALEALWTLHRLQSMDNHYWVEALKHISPSIRLWAIRLLGDQSEVLTEEVFKQIKSLARIEINPEVIAQLLCSLRRIPVDQSNDILALLINRDEILADPFLPNLVWWAVETNYSRNPDRLMQLLQPVWTSGNPSRIYRSCIAEFLPRRFVSDPTMDNLNRCADYLRSVENSEVLASALRGIETGLRGQSLSHVPPRFVHTITELAKQPDPPANIVLLGIKLAPAAWKSEAGQLMLEKATSPASRMEIIQALAEFPDSSINDQFLAMAQDDKNPENIRVLSITSLRSFPEKRISLPLIHLLTRSNLTNHVQSAIIETLAGYTPWTLDLLMMISEDKIPPAILPSEYQLILLNHPDQSVQNLANKIWNSAEKLSTAELSNKIAAILETTAGDTSRGKTVFATLCASCHQLHGQGGSIGPDLTGYERDNQSFLITSIVDPNLGVREEYELVTVTTASDESKATAGSIYSGFIHSVDSSVVTLRNLSGSLSSIPQSRVLSISRSFNSLMPEGLLDALSDQDIADLFAWLKSNPD